MDEIVKQAMAKWPNVPHCYGWLALDARGNWRMRDERSQALNLRGDRIANPALLKFINRNYTHEERGCWYFQNGPQRVYVNLEATPYVARTDPVEGFVLHTGEPLADIDTMWMTEAGQLLLQHGGKVALVDDRDMAQCLPQLRIASTVPSDDQLLAWLSQSPGADALTLEYKGTRLLVKPMSRKAVAGHFGFIPTPQTDAA